MATLQARLGKYPLTQGSRFSASAAQGPISIGWTSQPNALNAIMLYDVDAPGGIFLHYLLVDIPQGQVNGGMVLMPYTPPTPPDKAHTYVLALLRQTQPYRDIAQVTQQNFNVRGFLTAQNMQPETVISFFVQPDNSKAHISGNPNSIVRPSMVAPGFRQPSTVTRPISPTTVGPSVAKPITPTAISPTVRPISALAPITPTITPSITPTAVIPVSPRTRSAMFIPNTILNEREQAYCSCVLKVAAKQPGSCNLEKAWFEQRSGETCYNPYAVCAASVKTSTRECGNNYNYENLADEHLVAFANLHQIKESKPYNRQVMLNRIYAWKNLE